MSTTARDLYRRLWLLMALGLATTAALYGAYRGVHADAVPLASSSTSGVLELDTARDALLQAQESAEQDAASDAAATGDFHTYVSVANQSLALAAADDVTGRSGRLTLQTVPSLIARYEEAIEQAGRVRAGTVLHAAYMHNAQILLGTKDAGAGDPSVLGRLRELQQEQYQVVDRQTSFGWTLWLGWIVAAALCLALLVALAEAHAYLRVRFRRRWNRPLAGALVLLAAGAVLLTVLTWQTHTGLFHSRTLLRQPLTGGAISDAEASVGHRMADTDARAAVTDWIWAGGAALGALVVWGLLPRINEYRFRGSR